MAIISLLPDMWAFLVLFFLNTGVLISFHEVMFSFYHTLTERYAGVVNKDHFSFNLLYKIWQIYGLYQTSLGHMAIINNLL